MQVMCIDEEWITVRGTGNEPRPNFGDIDEVINGYIHNGDEYYYLARFGMEHVYGKRHFIPISDIDETEMMRETKTLKLQP